MKLEKFSPKQLRVLNWWIGVSGYSDCEGIICDGAVRSGKTFCLSLSFILWSFASFRGQSFALCGKTIKSLHRNLVTPLVATLKPLGFEVKVNLSQNTLDVGIGEEHNRYYLFGGKDESSAGLIQGVTLAGVLFDEVALMPRSFVEQALARCSVEGAKFWFNCNPEHPAHWFYTSWILKAKERNMLYLHFKMQDNPSLSAKTLERYRRMYTGVFYKRYVLGEWIGAYGRVYPMFERSKHVVKAAPEKLERYIVSCDYGTTNPTSMGLWGYSREEGVWYRVGEYYHCSRTTGIVKTDEEYADDLENLVGTRKIEAVIIDPSAASFIQAVRFRGRFGVIPADNDVVKGIGVVAGKLKTGEIKFLENCENSIREFDLYRWDMSAGKDAPVKQNDHAMDDIRYFATYVFGEKNSGFYMVATKRQK